MLANRTPLEAIEQEIEEESFRLAAGALLAMELERHCRSGTRAGCDCEYCQAKARATFDVGHAARHVSWGTIPSSNNRDIRGYGSCSPIYEDAWVLKHNVRERIRKEARVDLFELRNKTI